MSYFIRFVADFFNSMWYQNNEFSDQLVKFFYHVFLKINKTDNGTILLKFDKHKIYNN